VPNDPTTFTSLTFTGKLFMKGSKALDNWTTKATITFRINNQGIITKDATTFSGDVCKG
jgi:hypothetical protein